MAKNHLNFSLKKNNMMGAAILQQRILSGDTENRALPDEIKL